MRKDKPSKQKAIEELLPMAEWLVYTKLRIHSKYGKDWAEDALQAAREAILKAYDSFEEGRASIEKWCLMMASRAVKHELSFLREMQHQKKHIDEQGLIEEWYNSGEANDSPTSKSTIAQMLEEASPRDREILRGVLEERSQQEIAEKLGISRSAVQRSLARIARKYKHIINAH